jgi:CheY-like chemotaxis protein
MSSPKRRLLVVDDNFTFHQLVDVVFSEEFEVLKASDGQEGLELAREKKPDVILLDVMMPKVSGIEMLRSLQAHLETRSIPVLVLTGSHFDPSTQDLFRRESNVRAFLQKPCGAEALVNEVRGALSPKG